jgi:hypothetical protein
MIIPSKEKSPASVGAAMTPFSLVIAEALDAKHGKRLQHLCYYNRF